MNRAPLLKIQNQCINKKRLNSIRVQNAMRSQNLAILCINKIKCTPLIP